MVHRGIGTLNTDLGMALTNGPRTSLQTSGKMCLCWWLHSLLYWFSSKMIVDSSWMEVSSGQILLLVPQLYNHLKRVCIFGHLMRRTDSLEKTLMLGKIEGRRRGGWQRMRWLNGSTDSMTMSLSSRRWWRTGKPGMLQSMGSQRVRHDWVTEQQYYRTRGYKKKSCSGQEGEPCTLAHLNPILSTPVGQGTQGGKVWDTCC